MVDAPKAFYDLPRARFTWYRPDTGYYIEQQAIALREADFYDSWSWILSEDVIDEEEAKGTMAQEIWLSGRYMYGKPFLVPMPNPGRMIPTHPLEDDPLLFQEFANLNPTEEAVIGFANKHGKMFAETREPEPLLPGNKAFLIIKTPPLSRKQLKQDEAPNDVRESIQELVEKKWRQKFVEKRSIQEFLEEKWSPVIGETFYFWVSEITAMQNTVEVFRLWENNDIDSLKELIIWKDFVKMASEDNEFFGSILPGDVLKLTLMALIRFINIKLRNLPVLTELVMEEDGSKAEPYLVPCNLLSAMWLQFSQHVIGERRSKPCRICGEWVDVTKKRQMGKGWERHDKCASNVRARRSNSKMKVVEALRTGMIDDVQAKEIRIELSEANTFEALRAVDEKFKSSTKPRKPAAKKKATAKKPATKKAATKATGAATKGRS